MERNRRCRDVIRILRGNILLSMVLLLETQRSISRVNFQRFQDSASVTAKLDVAASYLLGRKQCSYVSSVLTR